MIAVGFIIEWILWLLIWISLFCCAWLQHWLVPDTMKRSKFGFIYETYSRQTLFYATLFKVVGVGLSAPQFQMAKDPQRIGFQTANSVSQMLIVWAIYQNLNKFSQEQYWRSLEGSSFETSQNMRITYEKFRSSIHWKLIVYMMVIAITQTVTIFKPFLFIHAVLFVGTAILPYSFWKMSSFLSQAMICISQNYQDVKKMNKGTIASYQRMNQENKKKFLKANAAGKQLAHFKKSLKKLEKLRKICDWVTWFLSVWIVINGIQLIFLLSRKGIFGYSPINDVIDHSKYQFVPFLHVARFRPILPVIVLLYYLWIPVSWKYVLSKLKNTSLGLQLSFDQDGSVVISVGSSTSFGDAPESRSQHDGNRTHDHDHECTDDDEISEVSMSQKPDMDVENEKLIPIDISFEQESKISAQSKNNASAHQHAQYKC